MSPMSVMYDNHRTLFQNVLVLTFIYMQLNMQIYQTILLQGVKTGNISLFGNPLCLKGSKFRCHQYNISSKVPFECTTCELLSNVNDFNMVIWLWSLKPLVAELCVAVGSRRGRVLPLFSQSPAARVLQTAAHRPPQPYLSANECDLHAA